jgi:NADPH-dependent 2,4-dienoyl-CoA reductase/sulfur reductase-like enzyme
MSERYDVIAVGAGPGGIAAATTAGEHGGGRILLVDDNPHAGGQIWRNAGHAPKGAQRWLNRLARLSSVERTHQTRVIAPLADQSLLLETPQGPRVIRYERLILATGARERFLPFPGWTLPGVVGAGGMQALVKSGLSVSQKRVVIAGTGPLLLAVADLLRAKGAVIPIIAEQTSGAALRSFAFSLMGSPAKLLQGALMRTRLLGVPYKTDSYPLRVTTDGKDLRVLLRVGSLKKELVCDYLACGFNLIPNLELPQALGCQMGADGFVKVTDTQETTVPKIFAVGELTGIGGLEKALLEGELAALASIKKAINGASALKSLQRARDFTRRLESTFALRHELAKLADADTTICRCEDVPLSAVSACLTSRDAKLQTRCGMGPCQGRICGPILQHLLQKESPLVRPPIFPTPIATLLGVVTAPSDPKAESPVDAANNSPAATPTHSSTD